MQRVSQLQLGLLFILFHFSTATGFMMSFLFSKAGYEGWFVILISVAGGLLISFFTFGLVRQRPTEFLVHYGKGLVGRWLHILIMGGTCIFFIHLASIVLRQLSDFLIQVYLPTTPSWMVASLFAFVIVIAVRSGIEAIFRCASGFFFVIFCTAAITPFLVAKELNTHRAIALITHVSWGSSFMEAYPFIPWFGEMFLIAFIFPFLNKPTNTYRTLLVSSLVSVIFIEISFMSCYLLFGAPLSAQLTYPVLEMIRFIRIGDFLENLDPFVVAIWLASLFIKISLLLYVAVIIFTQLMGLKDWRPFSFSFGAIMLALSIHMARNMIDMNQFLTRAWPTWALLVECSPLLYWMMATIRKKWAKA